MGRWDVGTLECCGVDTSDLKRDEFFEPDRVSEWLERVESVTWLDRVYYLWN